MVHRCQLGSAVTPIRSFRPDDLHLSSQPLLDWLKASGRSRVAVHFDVDVENAVRGFVHVPGAHDGSDVRGFDKGFYAQLGAESRAPVIRGGIKRFVWKKTRARNEALDCLVMGPVALESLHMNLDDIALLTVDDRIAIAEGVSQSHRLHVTGRNPRLSGGTSPDAENSTMRIVLRTSASNSASALPGSWKYSW
jgi:hypothetical protein